MKRRSLQSRLLSPEDNNERQMIHDHESVALRIAAPVSGGAKWGSP